MCMPTLREVKGTQVKISHASLATFKKKKWINGFLNCFIEVQKYSIYIILTSARNIPKEWGNVSKTFSHLISSQIATC